MPEHTVLVVDDEPIVRESIRDWLTEAGYRVATAETGEQALEMVKTQDFSVLVVDLRLPGKTGLAVLEAIKAERPWIKSIVITAYPSSETAQEARRLGAVDYVLKPFAPDHLERLIDDTLAAIPPEVFDCHHGGKTDRRGAGGRGNRCEADLHDRQTGSAIAVRRARCQCGGHRGQGKAG